MATAFGYASTNLFDQIEEVLGDLRSAALFLEDSVEFLSSQEADLGDSVLVSQDDTDLTLGEALFGVLDNDFDDFARCHIHVGWHLTQVRESRRTDSCS